MAAASSTADRGVITGLLAAVREGEAGALDRLVPLLYDDLHNLAHRQLCRGRPGQTLNTTALVHEAYLKLVDPKRAGWQDRHHFMAVAAIAMRHIVIDRARHRVARKRGGEARRLPLEEAEPSVAARAEELVALDEALRELAAVDPRWGRVVELHFFGGLTFDEIGEALGMTGRTAKRDWRKARAFLFRTLRERSAAS